MHRETLLTLATVDWQEHTRQNTKVEDVSSLKFEEHDLVKVKAINYLGVPSVSCWTVPVPFPWVRLVAPDALDRLETKA